MEIYNITKAMEGQRNYCNEKELPHFAPSGGRCYKCNKNIYEPIEHKRKNWKTGEVTGSYTTGISVERASAELITGCPHCHRSYCD